MRRIEINTKADVVAVRHGIPLEWVLHHVHQKAGKPCHRCGGSGIYSNFHGRCFNCNGTGGKATPAKVQEALEWVEENIERVKTLGERREKRREKRAAEKEAKRLEDLRKQREVRDAAMKEWQEKYPRHWWALQNMDDGEFKDSLVLALEHVHEGWMTEGRMRALWQKADALEALNRGDVSEAPVKGTKGSWDIKVTKAEWGDNKFGDHVFRIDFTTKEGWRGRAETRSKKVVSVLEGDGADRVTLTGVIRWSKGDYGIVGGRVKVTLPESPGTSA
jgi:hypothetical protein